MATILSRPQCVNEIICVFCCVMSLVTPPKQSSYIAPITQRLVGGYRILWYSSKRYYCLFVYLDIMFIGQNSHSKAQPLILRMFIMKHNNGMQGHGLDYHQTKISLLVRNCILVADLITRLQNICPYITVYIKSLNYTRAPSVLLQTGWIAGSTLTKTELAKPALGVKHEWIITTT